MINVVIIWSPRLNSSQASAAHRGVWTDKSWTVVFVTSLLWYMFVCYAVGWKSQSCSVFSSVHDSFCCIYQIWSCIFYNSGSCYRWSFLCLVRCVSYAYFWVFSSIFNSYYNTNCITRHTSVCLGTVVQLVGHRVCDLSTARLTPGQVPLPA